MIPDLARPQKFHIVAIGGAAMSAIAHILLSLGHDVSGSDQADSSVLGPLRDRGCQIWIGHDAAYVDGADVVVISTAIKPGHVEREAALAQGIPVVTRPDMMEALGRLRRTVAISGTHGKTTTSAMMALLLSDAGWDPSFIVGGQIRQLDTGVRWSDSEWFSVEADESDSSFLRFGAEAVIVTNIEPDHLDHHGTMEQLEAAFDQFVVQASGVRVVCVDDAGSAGLVDRLATSGHIVAATYGTTAPCAYQIVGHVNERLGSTFSIVHRSSTGESLETPLRLLVPGLHNARNATAVFAMACELGISPEVAASSLGRFTGVGRRFEFRGEVEGVTFVDDYAHLPTEVSATVSAAAGAGWSRVLAVFQPHRYTRVRDVGPDFAESFDGADLVVVTDLYAAGQQPIEGISSFTVSDAIRAARPNLRVLDIAGRSSLVEFLQSELRSGDLCLTMNAGDLTTLPDEMANSPWASTR